jgi:Ca-activated chloride channel homolog
MTKQICALFGLVAAAVMGVASVSSGADNPPGTGEKTPGKAVRKAVRSLGVKVAPSAAAKAGNLSKEADEFLAEISKTAKARKAPADITKVWGPQPAGDVGGAFVLSPAGAKTMGMPAPSATHFPGPQFSAPGKPGVTTGGMKDIGQARKMIEQGKIPAPEMIAVEAMLSEHDIPLEGEATGQSELYASASVAWARRYGREKPEAIVQIGFGIDWKGEVKRPPLNLAVVMDVSGSMGGTKIDATKKALNTLVDKLTEKDRLAIVLFDDTAYLLMESAPVTDKKAIREKIKEIESRGSTNIAAGMRAGYHQVAAHLDETDKSPRIFLLTDEQPNVGTTEAHGFKPMMEGAAAKGIGISAFGVGIDFGQALAYEIFQIRGANYFFLENDEKIAKVFDEEFDYMVTPLAYDVLIDFKPAKGAKVTDVMGVPDFKKAGDKVEMKIPSLFLSKRQGGGATLVAMEVDAPNLSEELRLAEIDLSFARIGEAKTVTQSLAAFLPGEIDEKGLKPYYSQPGAKKALLLADAAVAMRAACRGQKGPTQGDVFWCVHPPMPGEKPGVLTPPRGGEEGYYPYQVTIDKAQASEAIKGLGGFADWLAGQIADVPGAEKELRLMEKLENSLRTIAGQPAHAPRAIPAAAQPDTAPPNPDIF